MKLWKKVPVGGTTYSVYMASPEEVKRLSDGDEVVVAITLCNEKKIVIGWDCPPDAFAGTLLHELAHAVIYESHIDTSLSKKLKSWETDEEEIVKAIEATLTPALVATGWRPRKPKRQ